MRIHANTNTIYLILYQWWWKSWSLRQLVQTLFSWFSRLPMSVSDWQTWRSLRHKAGCTLRQWLWVRHPSWTWTESYSFERRSFEPRSMNEVWIKKHFFFGLNKKKVLYVHSTRCWTARTNDNVVTIGLDYTYEWQCSHDRHRPNSTFLRDLHSVWHWGVSDPAALCLSPPPSLHHSLPSFWKRFSLKKRYVVVHPNYLY
jgi:hypothetical protein